jgi:ribosome-binding factor A
MRRVNESVRAVVADGLGELKDPRIGMVTVTGVVVTPDLAEARVFVSVFGNDKKRAATLAGLDSARGVLQARINRQLSLRRTPTLTFAYDDSVERGVRMTKLIEDVSADLPAEQHEADLRDADPRHANAQDEDLQPHQDADDEDSNPH